MNKSEVKVIAILERVGGFASAKEIYQLLLKNGDSVGLTTIYRALQSLVDDKILDQLRREDGDRKSTRLNSSHVKRSRMPSSA